MPSVSDFIFHLSAEEQAVAGRLREIILECIPGVEERLSYGVPYFYRHSRICFIWPASAPNSGHEEGVMLGFCRGRQLSNETGLVDLGHRKEVAVVIFHAVEQMDEAAIRETLYEAVWIDEEIGKQKKAGY